MFGYVFNNPLTSNVLYFIGQVKPVVYSEDLSNVTGGIYSFTFKSRDKLVLLQPGGTVSAPVIQYSWYRKQILERRYINNQLQPDFYRSLDDGDTIGVKENWMRYTR
jgi:hypothetical protein